MKIRGIPRQKTDPQCIDTARGPVLTVSAMVEINMRWAQRWVRRDGKVSLHVRKTRYRQDIDTSADEIFVVKHVCQSEIK